MRVPFRRPTSRRVLNVVLTAFVVVAVAIWASVWMIACIRAERSRLDAREAWSVAARSDWPDTLRELVGTADHSHIHLGDVVVWWRPYYAEYYWRLEASAELLDLMTARWSLRPVSRDHPLVRFAVERMPSALSSSLETPSADCYVSADWLAGEKGHWYCVMNDSAHKTVVVRYYYNF